MNGVTLLYIAVMAGVTYLVRMLPMAVFRKKIKSKFVKSLLYYIPYAVLGAMTFPTIFYSTGSFVSALVGLAFLDKSLIIVACAACAAAYAVMLIGF